MDTMTIDEIRAFISSLPFRELHVSPAWGPYYRYQQKIGRLPAEPFLKITTSSLVPRDRAYISDPNFLEEIR